MPWTLPLNRESSQLRTSAPNRRVAPAPLDIVQIDHTRGHVTVVDPVTRLPIGRPTLTVAIDVNTRIVMGFYLSLEAPSLTAVALCLTHSSLGLGDEVGLLPPRWGGGALLVKCSRRIRAPATSIPDHLLQSKAYRQQTNLWGNIADRNVETANPRHSSAYLVASDRRPRASATGTARDMSAEGRWTSFPQL